MKPDVLRVVREPGFPSIFVLNLNTSFIVRRLRFLPFTSMPLFIEINGQGQNVSISSYNMGSAHQTDSHVVQYILGSRVRFRHLMIVQNAKVEVQWGALRQYKVFSHLQPLKTDTASETTMTIVITTSVISKTVTTIFQFSAAVEI